MLTLDRVTGSASRTELSASGADDDDLKAYARRSAVKGFVLLIALLAAIGLISVYFEAELAAATHWAHRTLGLPGLSLVIFLADSLTAPIPPDLVLIVVAKSSMAERWWLIVPMLGAVSVAAGNAAWVVGRWLGDTRIPRALFARFRTNNQRLVARYGVWGVALGAMTPIPFSITCWAAGMFHMKHRTFFWATLLRVPRYVLYYLAIAYSDETMRMFL